MLSFLLLLASLLPPRPAAHVAAWAVGEPSIASALLAICHRESRCKPIRVHHGDDDGSRGAWLYQTRVGHLDPQCQPYGRGGWATRGAWGLSAASHWQFLPDCYQPQILDVPIVSAYVAARKYLSVCVPLRSSSWCPRRNA